MMSENGDEHRREIVRRVQNQYLEAQRKHAKAEADAKQAESNLSQLEAAHLRAEQPPPMEGICPECWIMHDTISQLYAVPHEDPAHFDRMKCGTPGCGYFEDQRTGL